MLFYLLLVFVVPKFAKVATSMLFCDALCVFIDHFGLVPISWNLLLVYHLSLSYYPVNFSQS